MKKLLLAFISSLSLTLLSGCNIFKKKSSKESEPGFIGGDLIFSEFYIGENYNDRAIELTNVGTKELNLGEYKINLYADGGGDNPKPESSCIDFLNGPLGPGNTYIIAFDEASEEIKSKANLITFRLVNDGTIPMTIVNYDDKIIDYLGYPGYFYDFASHSDVVRKKDALKASEYSPYDWIHYPNSNLDNLGNLDCPNNDELFKGPKLTQEDFAKPYVKDGNGGGGAIEVSLVSTIDGDTTRFNFGNSLSAYDISGTESVRYYGINTPELAHNDNPADSYGPEARDFTNGLIKKAKHFVVQSVEGYSLRETYGRMLGYVWASEKDDPKPEDYYLLNHRIVQNGYARIGYIDRGGYNDYMLYNNISYVEYLYDAQQYAILNKLHIYEEGL